MIGTHSSISCTARSRSPRNHASRPKPTSACARSWSLPAASLSARLSASHPWTSSSATPTSIDRAAMTNRVLATRSVVADPAEQRQAFPRPAERLGQLGGGQRKTLQRPRALPRVLVAEQGQRLVQRGQRQLRPDPVGGAPCPPPRPPGPARCRRDRDASWAARWARSSAAWSSQGCRRALAAASPATAAGVAGGSPHASVRRIHSWASRRCPVPSQNRSNAEIQRRAVSTSPLATMWASAARRLGCSIVRRSSHARCSGSA